MRPRAFLLLLGLLASLAPICAACEHPSSTGPGAAGSAHAAEHAAATASPAHAAPPPPSTAVAEAKAAVARMVEGAKLLPAFTPAAAGGATERVDRPTKEGVAEVVYKKGKDEIATITITDTIEIPAVREDYKDAKEKVDGFPLKTSGYAKSAILVADRFQVQIQSQRLKAPERKAWLEKMDLKALQALK
jgi:hypothetical protein